MESQQAAEEEFSAIKIKQFISRQLGDNSPSILVFLHFLHTKPFVLDYICKNFK